MNTHLTPLPWSGRPAPVVLLFPGREVAPPARGCAHFWSQLQAYAEKKRERIAETFRGKPGPEEDDCASLKFPTLAVVRPGEDRPRDAA